MGPMGCGKTTVGRLLAGRLGWRFIEGDTFHPPANVEKMRSGQPLTDEERRGWLATLSGMIRHSLSTDSPCVLACSALKERYREQLGVEQSRVVTLYLRGSRELLRSRIEARRHPYMDKGLLDSQLEALEPPQGGIVAEIARTPEEIVEAVAKQLGK